MITTHTIDHVYMTPELDRAEQVLDAMNRCYFASPLAAVSVFMRGRSSCLASALWTIS